MLDLDRIEGLAKAAADAIEALDPAFYGFGPLSQEEALAHELDPQSVLALVNAVKAALAYVNHVIEAGEDDPELENVLCAALRPFDTKDGQ